MPLCKKKNTYCWPNRVYFDCNATTPTLLGAADAALDTMINLYGNPSSSHAVGIQAKAILETGRNLTAKVVGSDPEQIIFTSGATEAIHTAIFSALIACANKPEHLCIKLLYGATEHKVVPQALHHWVTILKLPYEIVELPVNENGQIIIEQLINELPFAALICTMAVNNETGVIHNLAEIEQTLIDLNSEALWLVDSVQSLGKLDLQLNSSRIDYAVFSGHKFYAPKGIGFLYYSKRAPLSSLIVGGGQENNFRSGTENLPGIAALSYVLRQFLENGNKAIFQSSKQLAFFRDKIVSQLRSIFPEVVFNTPFQISVPTTINFSVPGLNSKELLDLFDAAGLSLSGGSACSASSLKTSYVLTAMGKTPSISSSAIRLSFGACTTFAEIEECCLILKKCGEALNKVYLNNGPIKQGTNLQDRVLQLRTGSVNTWIIKDETTKNCIIIDPHLEALEQIEQYVICNDLKVLAILDTHSHADHETIRPLLENRLSLYFSEVSLQCSDTLGWPENSSFIKMVTLENLDIVPAITINATSEDTLILAQLKSPGHTDDSTTLLLGTPKGGYLNKKDINFVFSGDMLLAGGLGRTNFPTSCSRTLYSSLKTLYSIIDAETVICPAHDYNNSFCTNFKTEIETTPIIQIALHENSSASIDLFINKKIEIDHELANLEKVFSETLCGVTKAKNIGEDYINISIFPEEFRSFISNNETHPLIISVLEISEAAIFNIWDDLGLSKAPRNVPPSKYVNLIKELLFTKDYNQQILFVCRSGERSLQIVKSLRRLSFNNVWNLHGGLALLKKDFIKNFTYQQRVASF